jgi:tRNA 5-methylaminomethyl-2-thiouridine biosynthesis bifunctional protein
MSPKVGVSPARLHFPADGGPPEAPDFGDLYHPRIGAFEQARHVFLAGNGLPGRWRGRAHFTVLETGFGLGFNLLALWDAWQADAQHCAHLHVVSLELHPPSPEDLARAHATSPWPARVAALLAQWPPAVAGLHRIELQGGALQLTLALGDASQLLPRLRLAADAVFLDGFAPDRNPEMWSKDTLSALARQAAPGCTAATWSVAKSVHEALEHAGFRVERRAGIGGKREVTAARFEPRLRTPPKRAPWPLAVASADAVVVGAGVAGASVARALAAQGLAVTVLDRAAAPASGASGNPVGLFHAIVSADDGPHTRLYRAAALRAAQLYGDAIAAGVPGQVQGLLRQAALGQSQAEMAVLCERLGWPQAVLRALDAQAASALLGLPLPHAAWHFVQGGWIAPGLWVQQVLAQPGIAFRGGHAAASVRRVGQAWEVLDSHGTRLAHSPLLVLAGAEGSLPLLPADSPTAQHSRVARQRGQLSGWRHDGAAPLQRPLAGDGYAIATPGWLYCGATVQAAGADDADSSPRAADHLHNLARFVRLTGLAGPSLEQVQGRVGWRLHSADKLPLAGALPTASAGRFTPLGPQLRQWPREPGLFVLTALGSRGLTLAPLLGELIAAQATGTPWPLSQDLAEAVDPARWALRQARRAAAEPEQE